MADPFFSSSWYRVGGLRPNLRGHLKVHRHRYRGETWYVIEDGAKHRSHRFAQGSYLFIARLDGARSVDEIWQALVIELGDDAPTQDETIVLLAQLHGADLLQAGAPPDAAELLERHGKERGQLRKQNLKSPMSFRVPLVDPDAFLTRTIWAVRPLFGIAGALLWLLIVVPAIVLAGMHWTELTGNLSDRVFATQNVLILALCYPLVKTLHELGHGYAAKAYGGEVREMGIMFLVLFPVPYVDASSANALPSKWRRATVGAAGMLVELLLAALAMYAWVAFEPGLARAFAFNVMLIAGISTVLVNGNPLIRFDGYYILADLIEIPNLGAQANKYWASVIDRRVFRTENAEPFPASRSERIWFALYAPASFVMRMVMLFSIALFVAGQFFVIGVALALWAIFAATLLPLAKMAKHVLASPQLRRNRRRAVGISGAFAAAIVLLLFVVPAPSHTSTQGVVWLPEESYVRAGTDGVVDRLNVTPGTRVAAGQPLVVTRRQSLATEIEALVWRVRELEAQLDADFATDRAKAAVTRMQLAEERARLARQRARQARLVVDSPVGGLFSTASVAAVDLPGRYVREGEVMGYVTPRRAEVARVLVDQADIELVRDRLRDVRLKLPDRPELTYRSRVVREVPAAIAELPSGALGAVGGGSFAVDPRDPEGRRTLDRLFQLDVKLPDRLRGVPFGSRVLVRFELGWEPIGFQIARRIRQLLLARFDV